MTERVPERGIAKVGVLGDAQRAVYHAAGPRRVAGGVVEEAQRAEVRPRRRRSPPPAFSRRSLRRAPVPERTRCCIASAQHVLRRSARQATRNGVGPGRRSVDKRRVVQGGVLLTAARSSASQSRPAVSANRGGQPRKSFSTTRGQRTLKASFKSGGRRAPPVTSLPAGQKPMFCSGAWGARSFLASLSSAKSSAEAANASWMRAASTPAAMAHKSAVLEAAGEHENEGRRPKLVR